jgi:hypothetical protein
MTKIIFINGPKRAGKDTAGAALFIAGIAKLYKMTTPMDDALRGLFGFTHAEYKKWREDMKDDPSFMGGHKFRNVLISMSEDWLKRLFGKDIFGRLAVMRIQRMKETGTQTDIVAITDSGFKEEMLPLIKQFGKDNCFLIRVHRDGTSFDGDSRSFVELEDVTSIDIYNNYDEDLYKQMIIAAVDKWLHPQQS